MKAISFCGIPLAMSRERSSSYTLNRAGSGVDKSQNTSWVERAFPVSCQTSRMRSIARLSFVSPYGSAKGSTGRMSRAAFRAVAGDFEHVVLGRVDALRTQALGALCECLDKVFEGFAGGRGPDQRRFPGGDPGGGLDYNWEE